MPWDKRLRKKEIIIPYEHLTSQAQKIIGQESSIKEWRANRGFAELGVVGNATYKGGLPFSGASFLLRTIAAHYVQNRHRELVEDLNEHGIFRDKFSNAYPDGWLNPTTVAETHPVFFVDARGNLHFLKDSRTEYARHVFQKMWAGKIGLNMWRWRVYLRPPKVPESVVSWAKNKAKTWARAMAPSHALVPVGAKSFVNKKLFRKRSNK